MQLLGLCGRPPAGLSRPCGGPTRFRAGGLGSWPRPGPSHGRPLRGRRRRRRPSGSLGAVRPAAIGGDPVRASPAALGGPGARCPLSESAAAARRREVGAAPGPRTAPWASRLGGWRRSRRLMISTRAFAGGTAVTSRCDRCGSLGRTHRVAAASALAAHTPPAPSGPGLAVRVWGLQTQRARRRRRAHWQTKRP